MAKSIFLLEQPILQLADWLRETEYDKLRQAAICGDSDTEKQGTNPKESTWLEGDQRFTILEKAVQGDPYWQRVAIVCEAGLGKTTTLQFYQAHILKEQKRIPFVLQLPMATAGKRTSDNQYIPFDDVDDALLDYLARHVQSSGVRGSTGYLKSWLFTLRKENRLLLFLDGLDQALSTQDNPLVTHLKALLHGNNAWSNCPIWCAGRPAAFRETWKTLFAGCHWQFLRVESLPEEAIRRAMLHEVGIDFLEAFPPGAQHLLATPRYLELIWTIVRKPLAQLQKEQQDQPLHLEKIRQTLAHLQSVADVYHHACFTPGTAPKNYIPEDLNDRGLIGQGLAGPAAAVGEWKWGAPPDNYEERLDYVGDLLAALAFTLAVEYPETPFSAMVAAAEVKQIKKATYRRFVTTEPYENCREGDFYRDFDLISKEMNVSTLDFLILAEEGSHGLKWHDRTMATFFAAYWLMNHGSPTDQTQVTEWITDADGSRKDFFDEFWEIAAAFPKVDRQKWLEILRPPYTPPPHWGKEEGWVEWSRRVLHHSWERMQQCAPEVVAEYQSSFRQMKEGTPQEKRIYHEITEGLVPIPAGKCPFGYKTGGIEVPWIPIDSFQLHRWAVCNEWYEAFEWQHRDDRWIASYENGWIRRFGRKAMERCPVNCVDWYDAWAFAHWCGLQLPTELHWEYACRLGSPKDDMLAAYYWGNYCDGSECNCRGLAKYDREEVYFENPNGYLESIIPVDYVERLGYPKHQLDLANMSGNVDEWTASISFDNKRVTRGGCWKSPIWECRTSRQYLEKPGQRDNTLGFRLAKTV